MVSYRTSSTRRNPRVSESCSSCCLGRRRCWRLRKPRGGETKGGCCKGDRNPSRCCGGCWTARFAPVPCGFQHRAGTFGRGGQCGSAGLFRPHQGCQSSKSSSLPGAAAGCPDHPLGLAKALWRAAKTCSRPSWATAACSPAKSKDSLWSGPASGEHGAVEWQKEHRCRSCSAQTATSARFHWQRKVSR